MSRRKRANHEAARRTHKRFRTVQLAGSRKAGRSWFGVIRDFGKCVQMRVLSIPTHATLFSAPACVPGAASVITRSLYNRIAEGLTYDQD